MASPQPEPAMRCVRERVALIAGEGPREAIAEILAILAREGFALDFFDGVEAALEESGPGEPSAMVLWLEGAVGVSRVIEPLRERFEQSPVVLVCASMPRWGVRAALAAGAAGVVVHAEADRSLGSCLRAVGAGQTCVPRNHWREIERPVLSTREKQVLGLVVMGYMNSQIAERLFLAESTVKSHLSSAFGKLGVRSRNEAVDLILNPERGLGMGILGLGGQPLANAASTVA